MAEAEMSATRWTSHGTHQGSLSGIPPTGIQTTNSGITMSRWANGKIAEIWAFFDNLGLMQQLGVIPAKLE
jgi:predicted ester cyclase